MLAPVFRYTSGILQAHRIERRFHDVSRFAEPAGTGAEATLFGTCVEGQYGRFPGKPTDLLWRMIAVSFMQFIVSEIQDPHRSAASTKAHGVYGRCSTGAVDA